MVQTTVVQVELEEMCRVRDTYTLESIELKIRGMEEGDSRMTPRFLA